MISFLISLRVLLVLVLLHSTVSIHPTLYRVVPDLFLYLFTCCFDPFLVRVLRPLLLVVPRTPTGIATNCVASVGHDDDDDDHEDEDDMPCQVLAGSATASRTTFDRLKCIDANAAVAVVIPVRLPYWSKRNEMKRRGTTYSCYDRIFFGSWNQYFIGLDRTSFVGRSLYLFLPSFRLFIVSIVVIAQRVRSIPIRLFIVSYGIFFPLFTCRSCSCSSSYSYRPFYSSYVGSWNW